MEQKQQATVHERHNSREELERMFNAATLNGNNVSNSNNNNNNNQQPPPLRERNLPASFFKEPQPTSTTNGGGPTLMPPNTNFGLTENVVHSRIKSSPAAFHYNAVGSNSMYQQANHQIHHPKHHSSGAAFRIEQNQHPKQYSFDANRKTMHNPPIPIRSMPMPGVQPNSMHIRTGAGTGLQLNNGPLQAKLPEGFEKAFTETGEPYFVNHITKTTTWDDPRLTMMHQAHSPYIVPKVNNTNAVGMPTHASNNGDTALHELQTLQSERQQLEMKREEMIRKESEIRRQLGTYPKQEPMSPLRQERMFQRTAGMNNANNSLNGTHNTSSTLSNVSNIKPEPTSPTPMQIDCKVPSPMQVDYKASAMSPMQVDYKIQQQNNSMHTDVPANLSQGQMFNYNPGNGSNIPMTNHISNGGLRESLLSTTSEADLDDLIQSLSEPAPDFEMDSTTIDRAAIARIESQLRAEQNQWYTN